MEHNLLFLHFTVLVQRKIVSELSYSIKKLVFSQYIQRDVYISLDFICVNLCACLTVSSSICVQLFAKCNSFIMVLCIMDV